MSSFCSSLCNFPVLTDTMHILTDTAEIVQTLAGRAMVDKVSLREEGECVKELEDGVARLVDGHDNHSIRSLTESVGSEVQEVRGQNREGY